MELAKLLLKVAVIAISSLLIGVMAGVVWAKIATAQTAQQVDVALVLAIDESGSISQDEWKLQMDGYAAAFRDQAVLWAINGGRHRQIALAAFTWSETKKGSNVIIPWRIVTMADGPEIAAAFEGAAKVVGSSGSTDFAMAFEEARKHFTLLPYRAQRHVLDISGDGKHSNSWRKFIEDRQALLDAGVVVNGLPILGEEDNVEEFYASVIGGQGAFLVVANGFDRFPSAIQMKLMTEIGSLPPKYLRRR